MRNALSILRLARLDASMLAGIVVFAPLLSRTKDFEWSASQAVPLFFISLCTFIANDLDDSEKDSVNHPERLLPSGIVSPSVAATLYFIFLGIALFSTKIIVQQSISFLYYALFILAISYRYVVECIPVCKPFYVASVNAIPISIVAAYCPTEPQLYVVAGAQCLFVLGKEMCMDFLDRKGDPVSLMHRIGFGSLSVIAFSAQALCFMLLLWRFNKPVDVVALVVIFFLFSSTIFLWISAKGQRSAITLMKAQLLIGVYFLL